MNLERWVLISVLAVACGCGGLLVSGCGSHHSLYGDFPGGETSIAPSATVSGRVMASGSLLPRASVTATASPVVGAKVWIEDLPQIAPQFTDARGTYCFAGVTPGDHRVVAVFSNGTATPVLKSRTPGFTTVAAGGDAPDLVLTVAANIARGTLRDAAGNLLPAGVPLMLWGELFHTTTGGNFETPPMPYGTAVGEVAVLATAGVAVRPATFTVPFVSSTVPARLDLCLATSATGNQPPALSLFASLDGAALTTNLLPSGAVLTLEAVPSDQNDPLEALIASWSVTAGTLASGSDPWHVTWRMPTGLRAGPSTATLRVEVVDPQGAVARAELPIRLPLPRTLELPPVGLSSGTILVGTAPTGTTSSSTTPLVVIPVGSAPVITTPVGPPTVGTTPVGTTSSSSSATEIAMIDAFVTNTANALGLPRSSVTVSDFEKVHETTTTITYAITYAVIFTNAQGATETFNGISTVEVRK